MPDTPIPFNKPFLVGRELDYIQEAVERGKLAGDGYFTRKCQDYFCQRYSFARSLLTTSCTDALEMAAILTKIQPGDEVIAPSYTFVSTVNAFVLRGARVVFADCRADHPNVDAELIRPLITSRTRVIVVVHYAGVACDMDPILELARAHNLFVVEDAAQAVDSSYRGRPLGGIGDFGAFSFHETKNVISGEGGMLVVNRGDCADRAEIIREKGTDRSKFFRGEVDKYGWVDIGSSFLPSELIAAFLFAQLEQLELIQQRRLELWSNYFAQLQPLQQRGLIELPFLPDYATNNAHVFYLLCSDEAARDRLLAHSKARGILSVFHYTALHASPFGRQIHDGRPLVNTDRYAQTLVRLPLYHLLSHPEQMRVIEMLNSFFG